MKRFLVLLAIIVSAHATALPEGVRSDAVGRWEQWGSGEMTWFGLSLYRATLWVGGAPRDASDATLRDDTPLALALEYRRDIPAARIVQASVDEMRKLGATPEQLQRWETEMRRVFPDVRKGDVLTGLHLPGRGARFYFQPRGNGDVRSEVRGEVLDAEFARRFFAIWLDPRTSAPDVRAALLRQRAG